MKLKKCLSVFLVAILLLAAGCSGSTKDIDLDTKEAAASIVGALYFDEPLAETDKEIVKGYYMFDDDSLFEEYTVYTSVMGEEVAVFRVADKKNVDQAKALVEARLQKQKDLFEPYSPESMAKLEKAVIETRGKMVFYVVSGEDSSLGKNAISALYQ